MIHSFFRLLALTNTVLLAKSAKTSFVDDAGTTHEIPSGAKIMTGTMDAVTLFHFGMESSQIMGTFGERSASGSNFGGVYHDGNLADHGDHANIEYNPEHFPSDPDEAERAFLNMITDYSPSCSSSNYYCAEVNLEKIKADGWPDVIIFGSFYSFLLTEDIRGNATEAGVPIIELTTAYGSTPEAQVLPRGMIEITERWEELAGALMDPEEVAKTVEGDKKSFCIAATKFKTQASMAQKNGVRAMAGYLPYAGTGPNGEIGAFLASPERDTVLAMLEELGMPILHNDAEPDRAYEYQTDFVTGTLPFENIMSAGTVGDPVPYYVDFWLYDDRVTLDFITDAFAQSWPNKAVLSKQYAYFPANSRIFSYRHAADILNVIGEPLGKAVQLETDAKTECTPAAEGGYAGANHRNSGMLPGQYACYEPIDYDVCSESSSDSSFATSSKTQSFAFLASFGAIVAAVVA